MTMPCETLWHCEGNYHEKDDGDTCMYGIPWDNHDIVVVVSIRAAIRKAEGKE